MAKPETTALAVLNDKTYAALSDQFDPRALAEIVSDNTGGRGFTPFDLERIKIPAGGSVSWEVPSIEGPQSARELEGVIIYWRNVRSYWRAALAGPGSPPDCSSQDAIIGIGDPGGDCGECPLAEFGSSEKGSGQACKSVMQLFMLTPQSALPVLVAVPPTSIQPMRKFFLRLVSQGGGLSYFQVITKLGLEKAKNGAQQDFSRIVPSFGGVIPETHRPRLQKYIDEIRPFISAAPVGASHDDVVDE